MSPPIPALQRQSSLASGELESAATPNLPVRSPHFYRQLLAPLCPSVSFLSVQSSRKALGELAEVAGLRLEDYRW